MSRVGDSVVRPMMHALEDMPSLTRQLADVIRKNKVKQRRNNDGVTGIDRFDGDRTRIDVEVRDFTRNPTHRESEFAYQRNEQIEALQDVSVADWLRRREEYGESGRTPEALQAQKKARDRAFADMIDELVEEHGVPEDVAEQAARDWLKTQAATHRLDGIAGGDILDLSGVGDSNVNSSLGSQWRSRVGGIQQTVDRFVQSNPGADLDRVYLNLLVR